MTTAVWLRPTDCPLLQADADHVDPVALRLLQRLLEIPLMHHTSDALARAALEEIAGAVHAETAAILEATPDWQPRWLHGRRPVRPGPQSWPRTLLGEVLDQEAAASQPALD